MAIVAPQYLEELLKKFSQCPACGLNLNPEELIRNNYTCVCDFSFPMPAAAWIDFLSEQAPINLIQLETKIEIDSGFDNYFEKIEKYQRNSGLDDAVVAVETRIADYPVVLAAFDYTFKAGTMGRREAAKIKAAGNYAKRHGLPLVLVVQAGGIRVEESTPALMSMISTTMVLDKVPTAAVLTSYVGGGVLASFAGQADFVIAEKSLTAGFTGWKVITDFLQLSEEKKDPRNADFLMKNGLIDVVAERGAIIKYLITFLQVASNKRGQLWWPMNYQPVKFEAASSKHNIPEIENKSIKKYLIASRSPKRPIFSDYMLNSFDGFCVISNRSHLKDKAIIGGFAAIDQSPFVFCGIQKGATVEERKYYNLGQIKPEGYQAVLKWARLAEKLKIPFVTFIDTPGAHFLVSSDRRGISYQIGYLLKELPKIKTPFISFIIGEGGSGGALALLAGADAILMLENSYLSVASPDAAASIVLNSKSKIYEVIEGLRLTPEDQVEFNICNEIISEDGDVFLNVRDSLKKYLEKFTAENIDRLLKIRTEKILQF